MSESTQPPSDAPHRGEDKPLLGSSSATADESGSSKSSKLFENPPLDVAHHVIPTAHSNDVGEFVQWKDFFDVEKGWMKFWSPTLTFNQITSRERDDTLFCFDAFRCFAFLWVSNSHIQEGMVLYYGTTFSDWIDSTTAYAIYSTSSGGVVVFFVVSGFLNLMVAMSIARKFKDKDYYSWKSAKTFLFRRFMHLGPNLFITVLIALLIGCSSHLESLSDEFCTPCKSYWWLDYIFLGNFSNMMFGTACFNSTWTVSAQMQLYVLGLLINVIYFRHPAFAFAGALVLSVISIIIRTKLTFLYGDSPDNFSANVYTTSYCRIDSYMMGMMLWMIYEQILKPIHTKSYIPKHLRAQYLPANRNASLPTTTVNSSYGTSSTSSSVDPTLVDRADESKSNESTNLIKPQEKDIFTYMWHEVRDQSIAWYTELITNFHLFHTYATYTHIVSMYVLYPIMGYCMYLGVHYALTTETDEYLWSYWPVFSGMDQSSMTFASIRSSYALTSVALGTMGLLFFALEKVLLWPWSWICRWWVWYPIGMLSYTGYLLSILTAYLFFAVKGEVEGAQDWDVSTNTEGWWKYTVYFWVVLFINLIGATMLSFAVERPLMNLSKAIDV